MKIRRAIAVIVATAACFTALTAVQERIDRHRTKSGEEQLLYLPNEKLLNHFTAGLNSVVADLLWLQCVQYTGQHFRSDLKFTWLNQMCTTIVRLDPNFVDVYRLGGIFLAALKGNSDESIDLLKRGIPINPTRWELPYEIAMVYMLNRRDAPNSTECAAQYLNMAVATNTAPDWVIDLAANVQTKNNMFDTERQMWTNMLKSDDKLMREMAQKKLKEVNLRENLVTLNKAMDIYRDRTGRTAANLQQLVSTGILNQVPEDPLGGKFFIAPDSTIENTTLLDEKVAAILDEYRRYIDLFKEKEGRLPKSLDELKEAGIVNKLWPHPYPDRQWQYDPATGEVR